MTVAASPPRARPKSTTSMIVCICLALALVGVNLCNQASMDFSLLTGLFVILAYVAIQACGGLTTLYGGVVAYISLQHVVIGSFAKFVLGQPIEQRLDMPILTMEIYCLSMASICVGGYFGSRVARSYKKVLFPPIEDPKLLRAMALIATVLAAGRVILVHVRLGALASGQQSSAGILAVALGMQWLPLLACACATASCVKISGGRKCIDWLVVLSIAPTIVSGVASAGRGDTMFVLAAWLMTALAFGYRFRAYQFAMLLGLAYFAVYIFFPYARYARGFVRGADLTENLIKSVAIFEDVVINPSKYQDNETTSREQLYIKRQDSQLHRHWAFYAPDNETLSRFSLIKNTDMLVYSGLQRDPLEWRTTWDGVRLATPSAILEDKPLLEDNNMLGHLVPDFLGQKDFVTQPNTGTFADAFISFRWPGVLLVMGVLFFLYQAMFGFMYRLTLRHNVYTLAILLLAAHNCSEGAMDGHVVQLTTGFLYQLLGVGLIRGLASIIDIDKFQHILSRRSLRRGWQVGEVAEPAEA